MAQLTASAAAPRCGYHCAVAARTRCAPTWLPAPGRPSLARGCLARTTRRDLDTSTRTPCPTPERHRDSAPEQQQLRWLPAWTQRTALLGVSSAVVWLLGSGASWAMADSDARLAQLQAAAGTDTGPSFASMLLMACLLYWLVKAVSYFVERPDEPDADGKGASGTRGGRGAPADMMAHARAPIRSFRDGSSDSQETRNQSLAKSAVYHVATALRESQPRIHSMLLAEAAALRRRCAASQPAQAQAQPVQQPAHGHHLALPPSPTAHDLVAADPVAQMVAERVDQLTAEKGPLALEMEPRAMAALEAALLEELAGQVARSELVALQAMASAGKLRVDGKPVPLPPVHPLPPPPPHQHQHHQHHQ